MLRISSALASSIFPYVVRGGLGRGEHAGHALTDVRVAARRRPIRGVGGAGEVKVVSPSHHADPFVSLNVDVLIALCGFRGKRVRASDQLVRGHPEEQQSSPVGASLVRRARQPQGMRCGAQSGGQREPRARPGAGVDRSGAAVGGRLRLPALAARGCVSGVRAGTPPRAPRARATVGRWTARTREEAATASRRGQWRRSRMQSVCA